MPAAVRDCARAENQNIAITKNTERRGTESFLIFIRSLAGSYTKKQVPSKIKSSLKRFGSVDILGDTGVFLRGAAPGL